MSLRRIAATLLILPLLHLNMARAAIACDRHEEEARTDQTAALAGAMGEHAPHGSHGAEGAPTSHDVSPESGESAECCRALVACSLAFGVAGSGALEQPALIHVASVRRGADALRSRIASPEPPPPKA